MGECADMMLDGILDYNGEYSPQGSSYKEPKMSKCKICDKETTNIKRHHLHHHKYKKIPCPCCGKELIFAGLKQHIIAKHGKNIKYKCPRCPTTLVTLEQYINHKCLQILEVTNGV